MSATNRYRVLPAPSTRIWPSLALLATAIVVPFAAGLGDGCVDGLALAVDCAPLPQAATTRAPTTALVTTNLDCMHGDTEAGYVYSGVTYAAVRPPSTMNVAPFT